MTVDYEGWAPVLSAKGTMIRSEVVVNSHQKSDCVQVGTPGYPTCQESEDHVASRTTASALQATRRSAKASSASLPARAAVRRTSVTASSRAPARTHARITCRPIDQILAPRISLNTPCRPGSNWLNMADYYYYSSLLRGLGGPEPLGLIRCGLDWQLSDSIHARLKQVA